MSTEGVTHLFSTSCAANFLVIEPLLDLTAQTISKFWIDKPVDQIRRIFNIATDFTEEEEIALFKQVDKMWL